MPEKSVCQIKNSQSSLSCFQNLDTTVANAPVGIFAVTIDGIILSANSSFVEMLGYSTPEELLSAGSDIGNQFRNASGNRVNVGHLLENHHRLDSNRYQIIRQDGSSIWIVLAITTVMDSSKTIVHYEGFITDITELVLEEKVLREKSEKLERHFFLSMDLLCIAKTTGEFIRLNPEWEKTLGYSVKELLNQKFLNLVHPEDLDATKKAVSTLEAQQNVINFENRYRCKDGSYRWIEWRSRLQGNLIYAAARDITERKKAELALLYSEKKYRDIFEKSQITFYEVNFEGVILDISPSVETMTRGQYKPEDLIGKLLSDFYADYRDRELLLNELQKHGSVTDYEIRLKNLDGTIDYFSISSKIIRDADGRLQKIIGNLLNLTERKQAEKALSESESRFKALHNASFGGISIHDKGIILECNQGLADMTGYSTAELVGMNGLLLIAEDSRDYVLDKIISGYVKPYEAIGLRKNGEEFPMRLEARNIPYKGKIVRVVEFRDISEQKLIEHNQKKLELELLQAKKMESVGRLAGGVAHDFNNMLSVILGYSELALNQVEKNQPVFEALEGIQQAAKRSADLTRQLLAFARKQTVIPEVLDLNDTLTNMLTMLRRMIGEDVELEMLPGENLAKIKIDPSQIDQIVVNLVINARDAIVDTGKITIETSNVVVDDNYSAGHPEAVPGEYVQIAMSDDGHGMDLETLSQLFEPFFTTKETGKGTGLGLATVYGIVKQNDGFINVYSEPGYGTTFKIYLPKCTVNSEPTQELITTNQKTDVCETILLVEDEVLILEMTKMMAEHHGYTVLVSSSPSEAIQLVKEYPDEINLLITDVILPEMNGRLLAQKLCSNLPQLKVLFMSGYTANVIAHHGVLDEGVNFIQKPFTQNDLIQKIREVLSSNLTSTIKLI